MMFITVRCSVCLGSQSAVSLVVSNHPYEYQPFGAPVVLSVTGNLFAGGVVVALE